MTIELQARPPIGGPVFVGSYDPGSVNIEPWEPQVGNTVTLKSGDVTILVRVTQARDRQYVGEVFGFERWIDEEYNGLREGSTIEFGFDHIFGCMR